MMKSGNFKATEAYMRKVFSLLEENGSVSISLFLSSRIISRTELSAILPSTDHFIGHSHLSFEEFCAVIFEKYGLPDLDADEDVHSKWRSALLSKFHKATCGEHDLVLKEPAKSV